jgi:hypothetical protein
MTEAEFNKLIPASKGAKPQPDVTLSPEQGGATPKEQMKIAELAGMGPRERAPAEVNTSRNPYKSPIETVPQGDYQKARINGVLATNPIKTSGNHWLRSMVELKKASPEEYANFWKAVENPNAAHSPQLQEAITRWRDVANRAHGTSQALGGNTNYIAEYARHPWDLSGLEDKTGPTSVGGKGFTGIDNMSRKHMTIAEGEAAGLKLSTDPLTEGQNYITGASNRLHREAVLKGLAEADSGQMVKPHTLDLGYGHTVQLSDAGMKQAKAYAKFMPSTNPLVKGARTANVALKSTLLTGGQFHPINISAIRAAPTLLAEGHPIRAAKGLGGTFRPLFPGGAKAVDRMYSKALKEGMVDKGAMVGMPYGEGGYNAGGSYLKHGVGHGLVFEKQLPMMHDQMVRSVVADLEKKGIPLNSIEARKLGQSANATMGFVNREVNNISPRMQQRMGDFLLASQFTPSKWLTNRNAFKGGKAGSYARADIATNVVGAFALISGGGYLMQQKSDNTRDMALRALIDPAIPTNQKDSKGNTIDFKIPSTNTNEIAKLLGIKLVRQKDGHLGVDWSPKNTLKIPSNIENYMKSRLAPIAGDVNKVATNQTYAGKALYDPKAPLGQQAIQAATTLAVGHLPIGLQGAAYTKLVKDHVPGSAKEILDANTPGTNPLVKSLAGSTGFSPRTDMTVGKGLDTARYFSALDTAKQGLSRQETDALDLFSGSKKNPVTGKYDVQPNVNDSRTKASVLLQNPKAIDKLVQMNKTLADQGQKVDPLWQQSKDRVTAYLQYQAMPPGGADRAVWADQNPWYYGNPNNKADKGVAGQRTSFFDTLPAGDPNKPKLDLQYPDATPQLKSVMDGYSNITDSKQKGAYLDQHPELLDQWKKQSDYTNNFRKELGYTPFKNYPEATPQLQSYMDKYSAADKATKKGIRNSDPKAYQNMIAYYDSLDLYNINKEGAKNQLQGQPDQTSKQNKAISGLAKDIYQNADGTYQIVPAGWMDGLKNGSGGGGGYGGGGGKKSNPTANAYEYAVSLKAGGKAASANVAKPKVAAKAKSAGKVALSKPKVSSKKSMV